LTGSANLNFEAHQVKALKDQRALKQPEMAKELPKTQSAIQWVAVSQNGKIKLEAKPNITEVDFTTVTTNEETIGRPETISLLGYKVNIRSKVDFFLQAYSKNYQLARSHNLMVARFAEFKVAFLGYLLSLLGLSSKELLDLQKKALSSSIKENKILFNENEYNAELLAIVGGGGNKKLKAQKRAIAEIRKQLVLHAERLGLENYYSKEKVTEIQLEQCRKIYEKFCEEKLNLEYLRAFGVLN